MQSTIKAKNTPIKLSKSKLAKVRKHLTPKNIEQLCVDFNIKKRQVYNILNGSSSDSHGLILKAIEMKDENLTLISLIASKIK